MGGPTGAVRAGTLQGAWGTLQGAWGTLQGAWGVCLCECGKRGKRDKRGKRGKRGDLHRVPVAGKRAERPRHVVKFRSFATSNAKGMSRFELFSAFLIFATRRALCPSSPASLASSA